MQVSKPRNSPREEERHEAQVLFIFAIAAGVLALGAPVAAFAQNKVNLGVAIPAATHSFTAGIVWWANEAKAELEKQHKT